MPMPKGSKASTRRPRKKATKKTTRKTGKTGKTSPSTRSKRVNPREVHAPAEPAHTWLGEDSFKGTTQDDQSAWAQDDIRRFIACEVHSPPIHASFMSDLWFCPFFMLMRDRLGAKRKDAAPSAADTGSFFHKALEYLVPGKSLVDATSAVHAMCNDRQRETREHYDSIRKPEKGDYLCEDLDRSADLALVMAQIFNENQTLDPKLFTVVRVEAEVRNLPLPEFRHTGGGRIDLIVYSHHLDGIFIVDFKSVGDRIGLAEYFKSASYNFQGRWYRLLAERLFKSPEWSGVKIEGTKKTLGQVPVLGFIVAAMQKPSISQKKDQSFDDFLEECRDYYAGRDDQNPVRKQRTKAGAPAFDDDGNPLWVMDSDTGEPKLYVRWKHAVRAATWIESPPTALRIVKFDEPVIPQELHLVASMTGRALKCRPTLANFPRCGVLTGGCKNRYNRPCPYADICSSDPRLWQQIVDKNFVLGKIHGQDEPTSEEE